LLHSSAILNTFHSAFATITVKQIHTNMWICSIAWKRDNLFKSRRFYCIYCNEIALAKKRLWMCYHASYVTVHHWCYDRFTFTLSQQFITNEVLKLIIHIKIPKSEILHILSNTLGNIQNSLSTKMQERKQFCHFWLYFFVFETALSAVLVVRTFPAGYF